MGATIIILTIVAMIAILFIGAIQAGVKKKKENKKQQDLVELLLKKEAAK